MSKHRRVAALSMLLLLAVTALSATASAGSPDPGEGPPVEGAEDVQWKDLPARNFLFFHRADETSQIDEDGTLSSPGQLSDNLNAPGALSIEKPEPQEVEGQSTLVDVSKLEPYLVDEPGVTDPGGTTGGSGTSLPTTAKFQSAPLAKTFEVSGANVMSATAHVIAGPELNWTMQVYDCEDQSCSQDSRVKVGEIQFTADQETTPLEGYRPQFTLSETIPFTDEAQEIDGKNRYVFEEDHVIRFEMTAEEGPNVDLGVFDGSVDELPTGSRFVWILRRDGPTLEEEERGSPLEGASHLQLNTQDATQTAGWLEDHDGNTEDLFVNSTDQNENELDARYLVRSAFGFDDVDDGKAIFELTRTNPVTGENETVLMQPGDNATVKMEDAAGFRDPSDGQIGFELPDKYWDYHEEPPGEYQARMGLDSLRALGGPGDLKRQWNFRITDQEVGLRMYEEDSNTRLVQPGGSTTFLVNVSNPGSSTDTFDVDVRAPQAAEAGWRTQVAAPNLDASNELKLKPDDYEYVRVTVSAPQDTDLGTSQSFTFNVTSGIDDDATREIVLIATTSNEERQDVDVIAPSGQTVDVDARGNETITLYVRNNATVTNDLNAILPERPEQQNWNVSLRSQGRIGENVSLKAVPPGDVATVDVHFETLGGFTGEATNSPTITGTIAGISEDRISDELQVEARVELLANVAVDVLNAVDAKWRHMEMECPSTTTFVCPSSEGIPRAQGGIATEERIDTDTNDGVEQTLFRTWVSNTGDQTHTYSLSTTPASEETVNEVETYRCDRAFRPIPDPVSTSPQAPDDAASARCEAIRAAQDQVQGQEYRDVNLNGPEIKRYSATGQSVSPAPNSIELEPEQTAEFYVLVEHQTDFARFAHTEYTFAVEAECIDCDGDVSERDEIKVRGGNGIDEKSEVAVTHVNRSGDYDEGLPLVNKDFADDLTRTKSIFPGEQDHRRYCVRVTHGGAHAPTEDDESEVTVSLSGIETEDGWDADLYPIEGQPCSEGVDTSGVTPVDSFTFDNDCRLSSECGSGEALSYQEREFLIEVQAPDPDEGEAREGSSSVIVQAESSFGESAIAKIKTEIESAPKLEITPRDSAPKVQPGEGTAFAVDVENVGTAAGKFHVQAEVDAANPNWEISKPSRNVTIEQETSRSLTYIVRAPSGVAPGQVSAEVDLKATWADQVSRDFDSEDLTCENAANEVDGVHTVVECDSVPLEVVAGGDLEVNPDGSPSASVRPDGQHTFGFEVQNTGDDRTLNLNLSADGPSDWTAEVTHAKLTLDPGESRPVDLFVVAPSSVVEGASHSFVVEANSGSDDIAQEVFTVDIVEGKPRPVVEIDNSNQLIERGSFQTYEVEVKNRGSANGTFDLSMNGPSRSGWDAFVEDESGLVPTDANGNGNPDVFLRPNEQTTLVVNVTAPFEDVDRGTVVEPTFIAFANSFQSSAEASIRAEVQDYGVQLQMPTTDVDYIPGTDREIPIELTNTGNGNDTLNVSMALQGLESSWTVTFDESRVRLEPGESETVRAEISSPRSPLPSSRSVTFVTWAGSTRGADTNQWQNRSQPFVLDILEYRSQDVDQDGFVELAVDTTPSVPGDGFPHYREIFPEGENATLRVSFDGDEDGKPDFLIDDPSNGGIDGIADVYWDPDDVTVDDIRFRPDADHDESPDYLVDADGDDKVDTFWNSGNETRGDVDPISLSADVDADKYVLDTSGDGEFDKFYDPASGLVTETDRNTGQGGSTVGLDTTGDGSVDTYYDTQDQDVEAATFENASQFAQDYWYMVILFALVIVVGAAAISRR